jgi:Glycosyl hydrolase family 26
MIIRRRVRASAAIAFLFAACSCSALQHAAAPVPSASVNTAPASPPPSAALHMSHGRYIGVIAHGMPASYAPAARFSKAIRRRVNLVAYYSGWNERFQVEFAKTAWRYGAMTVVEINPTSTSMHRIASGGFDTYLTSYAQSVRAFGHPVVLSFGHEMNGVWYSYGYRHVTPAAFVAAWRHVHEVFARIGARNVIWLWQVNAPVPGKADRTEAIGPLYPGDAYVDWTGIDGYDNTGERTFGQLFGATVAQVRAITGKPILIAETAVHPGPRAADQVTGLFRETGCGRLLGFVWFNVDKSNARQGQNRLDWVLQDDPPALVAFRKAAAKGCG